MTATPDLLRAIADLRETYTPEQLAAMAASLQAKVNQKLTSWGDSADIIANLQTEIDADAAALGVANTGNAAAAVREAQQAGYITELQATIAALQAAISDGAPPATPEDIAERDEVHALLDELGITLPELAPIP
jgi:hypothetical protein